MRRPIFFLDAQKASQRNQIILVGAERHEIDSSRAKELAKIFAPAFLLGSEGIANGGASEVSISICSPVSASSKVTRPTFGSRSSPGSKHGHGHKIVAAASD